MYTENRSHTSRFISLTNLKCYFFRFISVFETTALFDMSVHSSFLWLLLLDLIGSLINLFIADIKVWPNFCYSYEYFFALKGS